ncbi:MAG: 8-oxo-dGTP diphosphatase [Lachnospiraceae bacterium]|nr:8-oxo-dGTP diphosphatase [Lachnospiraceae bacterium]
MSRMELTELTVLCLVYRDHQILLQNRVKKDWRGYTLPGGHVEPGESFVDAVVREMKEETGLTILHPQLCGVKQFPIAGGRYVVFLFKTDQFTGVLHSSEEGTVEWVDRSHLAELALVEDFQEILDVMERDDLTEFQYLVDGEEWTAVIR